MYDDDKNDAHTARATSAIIDAYLECLQARREYIQASHANLGDEVGGVLHQQLQYSVMSFYETLRYHLRTKSSVSDYWGDSPLWTETQYVTDEAGQVQFDANGRPVVEEVEVRGLKQLEQFYNATRESTQAVADAFGTREIAETTTEEIPAETLFRIARTLDEAAEKLGLLSDVKTPVAAPEEAEV